MRTIRRNTKEMERVLSDPRFVRTSYQSHNPWGNFLEYAILPKAEGGYDRLTNGEYLAYLLKKFPFAKLYDDGNEKYRLIVTSDRWYKFEA